MTHEPARAKGAVQRAVDVVQARLLLVMCLVYVAAGLTPGLGRVLHGLRIGSVALPGERPVELSFTNLLLASMLFTSGLGVDLRDLRALVARPGTLIAGVAANALAPLAFLGVLSAVAPLWPEAEEAQSLLVGFALIGAMPIAGGASVWTQNAEGNVPLTVGLVLGSTLLSPLTIPLVLRAAARVLVGDYAEDLRELAGDGVITFSLLSVVIPCFLGIAVRRVAGAERLAAQSTAIKATNLVVLLTLSYSNASNAMADLLAAPDLDMLAMMFVVTSTMCLASFAVGERLARALGSSKEDTISLTFGVGMNNSSASSVLASSRLADHALVLVPILAYSMLQKVLAGGVDRALRRRNEGRSGLGTER